MQSVLPERWAQEWLEVLVDEARTTFSGILEELVGYSRKPAELGDSSSFSFAILEDRHAEQLHPQRGSCKREGRKRHRGVTRHHRLPVL